MSNEPNGNGAAEPNPVLAAIAEIKGLLSTVDLKLHALHGLVNASTNDQATLHQITVDHETRLKRLELDFARAKTG